MPVTGPLLCTVWHDELQQPVPTHSHPSSVPVGVAQFWCPELQVGEHVPAEQDVAVVFVDAQGWPQPPQLGTLVSVSRHLPPHTVSVQMQAPLLHVGAAAVQTG